MWAKKGDPSQGDIQRDTVAKTGGEKEATMSNHALQDDKWFDPREAKRTHNQQGTGMSTMSVIQPN